MGPRPIGIWGGAMGARPIGKNKKVTIMNDEYLEEQIVQQIEVLVDELGGTLKQLTRADSTGRMSKVIEIEYNTN